MNDPNVVVDAPNVSAVLGGAVGSEEGLRDRARGVMLGLAVGNLLGLPMEGWAYREIDRWYPDGVRDIDPREVLRPMDDDLAQAVDLGEALLGEGTLSENSADGWLHGGVRTGGGLGLRQTASSVCWRPGIDRRTRRESCMKDIPLLRTGA